MIMSIELRGKGFPVKHWVFEGVAALGIGSASAQYHSAIDKL